eukprot:5880934-Pyramimonas_sp.AAC.1
MAKVHDEAHVYGMSPSSIQSWRRAIGGTFTAAVRGRCLDTLLQLGMNEQDLAISQVFRMLDSWVTILTAGAEQRSSAARDWAEH